MIPRQEEGVVGALLGSRAAFKTEEPVTEITGWFQEFIRLTHLSTRRLV